MSDMVNNPPHYTQIDGLQCIDVIERLNLPHHVATAFAYIWRHEKKGGARDIRKAIWYLSRYADMMERQQQRHEPSVDAQAPPYSDSELD